ncbi:MAG TPA: hypothetical protein VF553_23310 [Pyrinomonadaceae bacterium]
MSNSSQKVMARGPGSQEKALTTPRFDEAAAQMARPVVPLRDETASDYRSAATSFSLQATRAGRRKGSWLIAALVGLLMAVGAMAIGVTAYRRNRVVSTRSLAPVADAARIDIDRSYKPVRKSSNPVASVSAAPRKIRPRRTTRSVSSINPGARLVDRYVIR